MFGDILSNETVEEITQITSSNEQQNYRNTLDFIAYKARRDQMINDYILTQYSLKVRLKKFGKGGRKATMKELHQMQHDYKKLQHQFMYLQTTAFLPLILKVDGKGTNLYIDETMLSMQI